MMTKNKIRIKKITSILVTLAILLTFVSIIQTTVNASENPSDGYDFGKTESDFFGEGGGERYYKFSLETSGEINFILNAEIYHSTYQVYCGNIIKKEYLLWENSGYASLSDDILHLNEIIDLTSGNYTLRVSSDYEGEYSFSMNFTSAQESFKETEGGSNNSFDTANTINLNTDYKAQIAINDTVDYYKFVLDKSGRINFKLNSTLYYSSYEICDEDFNVIWSKSYYASVTTEILDIDEKIDLVAGTYYLVLKGNYYDYDMDYVSKAYESRNTGAIDFSVGYQSSDETFSETQKSKNNSFDTATAVDVNKDYTAQIALNDEIDYYKFTVQKGNSINLIVNTGLYHSSYAIYDENKNEIWQTSRYRGVVSEVLELDKIIELTPGTYYFAIISDYEGYDNDYLASSYEYINTGDVKFRINADVPVQIGDVNRDGAVNIVDATLVQKYIVGLISFNSDDLIIADVNNDGYITVRDATTIQKIAVGLG